MNNEIIQTIKNVNKKVNFVATPDFLIHDGFVCRTI